MGLFTRPSRLDDVSNELKGDIGDLKSLVYVILAGIIALIGFVIWDRRTALSPVSPVGILDGAFTS